MVLMDFKPANIIRCVNAVHETLWKAIDFDCSRVVGEAISSNITAEYGCFEVAKYVTNQQTATCASPSPLVASTAMDVCSLGWIAWKLLNHNQSLWDKLGLTGNREGILQSLSTLMDIEIFTRFSKLMGIEIP